MKIDRPHEELLVIGRMAEASYMPVAPARELIPRCRRNLAIIGMHETVCALHLAAFVGVYGPAPLGAHYRAVHLESGEGVQPCYELTADPGADAMALHWIDSAVAGLDTWSEAGFPNPLTWESISGEADQLTVRCADFVTSFEAAETYLVAAGMTKNLANLAAVYGRPDGSLPRRAQLGRLKG